MKSRLTLTLVTLLLLFRPARSAPPDVETQTVPFLGMATTEATPPERARAGLPRGIGLTVRYVLPNSPAKAAGVKRLDVLHKLDDQILVNDPQFRVLIRMHQPGDEIVLTIIRQAKPVRLTVVLDRREVPVAEVPPAELVEWLLRPSQGVGPVAGRAGFSASYEDDKHVLILQTDKQGRHLLAMDKQGKILFDGPVNTQNEREAVPGAIRPKLKRLETPPKPAPIAVRPARAGPATPSPAAPAAASSVRPAGSR